MSITITNIGAQGPWLKDGQWGDTIRFQVSGATTRYAALAALNTGGQGWNGSHPTLSGHVGYEVNPLLDHDGIDGDGPVWIFETKYKLTSLDDPTPTARRPLISWKWGIIQEPCDTDALTATSTPAGPNTIVNSAGDPLQSTVCEGICAFITEVKYFAATSVSGVVAAQAFVPNTAKDYINKINSAAITIGGLAADKHTLRCASYAPASQYYLNSAIIPITFEWEWRPNGFDRQYIDKGYTAWYTNASGTPTGTDFIKKGKLIDKTSRQPISEPALLDGTGMPLNAASYAIADPKFNHFVVIPTTAIPAYVDTNKIALISGGYKLPYQIYSDIAFSYFTGLGL